MPFSSFFSRPVSQGRFSAWLLFLSLLFFSSPAAHAQRVPTPGTGLQSSGLGTSSEIFIDVLVSVREPSGLPLSASATVQLYPQTGGMHFTQQTQDDSTARFNQVRGGDYDIEVTAPGYRPAKEHASVFTGAMICTLYVYLHIENEAAEAPALPKGAAMTPRLQEQIDKGLEKMRRKQFDDARAQFLRAAKMAPGNPDVLYLLGTVETAQDHLDTAREKFQAALQIYPSHEHSLLALGELQLRAGDPAGAAQTLEKVYRTSGADWRTHMLLANAYTQQRDYDKALPHALKVVDLARENAAPGWLLLAQIYVAQKNLDAAQRAFETIVRSFPRDPAAGEAKSQLAALEKNASVADVASKPLPVAPLLPPATVRSWAPPDIDSKEYPAVQDVWCSETDLVERTQKRIQNQLQNFERFLATEHIEHQEVNANGSAGLVREKDFNYLVFIQHPKPGLTFLEERRDGGVGTESFPTSLATVGLMSLGINVFDPSYEAGLTYKCEGLGAWRGKATWRLRFEQRKEVPSQIRLWRNNHGTYRIPLKGRVWIDASSYDVLHIETDLREPVNDIFLTRDHLIVDYGPVGFERNRTSLWLPWNAEMFLEIHAKRYHHTHALRNYMLFSVDTTNTISKPKETTEENNERP